MKTILSFFALSLMFTIQSFVQTPDSKIIYQFPKKGTAEAKAKTLKPVNAVDSKHNFLILTKKSFIIAMKNGKQYQFQKIDNTPGIHIDEYSLDIYIPKTSSSDPLKDKMGVQIYKKWIVLTDIDNTKQYFKLTNEDSFDEADALFG